MVRSAMQRRNTAHSVFLQFHKHQLEKEEDGAEEKAKSEQSFEMFHQVMKTGVIYATTRANHHGFTMLDEEWANMGQGAPETGPLPGAPSRDFHMNIQDAEVEYAPTSGIKELREKVANYYNTLYR